MNLNFSIEIFNKALILLEDKWGKSLIETFCEKNDYCIDQLKKFVQMNKPLLVKDSSSHAYPLPDVSDLFSPMQYIVIF